MRIQVLGADDAYKSNMQNVIGLFFQDAEVDFEVAAQPDLLLDVQVDEERASVRVCLRATKSGRMLERQREADEREKDRKKRIKQALNTALLGGVGTVYGH